MIKGFKYILVLENPALNPVECYFINHSYKIFVLIKVLLLWTSVIDRHKSTTLCQHASVHHTHLSWRPGDLNILVVWVKIDNNLIISLVWGRYIVAASLPMSRTKRICWVSEVCLLPDMLWLISSGTWYYKPAEKSDNKSTTMTTWKSKLIEFYKL